MKMLQKNKMIVALFLGLTGALSLSGTALADEPSIEEQEVTACIYEKEKTEKLTVLFDDNLPGIPYMNVTDYVSHIFKIPFEEIPNDDGTFTVKNEYGDIIIDPDKDTVTFESYTRLTSEDNINQETSEALGGMPFIKETGVSFIGENAEVTLRLEDYGIDAKASNDRVYLPLPTLSDLFCVTYNSAEYVDGTIYFLHVLDDQTKDGYFDKSSIYNVVERDPEVADFTYRELCFSMDHFYGRPSKAMIATSIGEKGFDLTLDEYSDETRKIKKLLQSTNAVDHVMGIILLQPFFEDGGHTNLTFEILSERLNSNYGETEFMKAWQERSQDAQDEDMKKIGLIQGKSMLDMAKRSSLQKSRNAAYAGYETVKTWPLGDKVISLIRHGDTAVFVFDSFKEEAVEPFKWSLDYAKKQGLLNFVIDISGNGGGHTLVLEYILAMITNAERKDNVYHLYNQSTLTGDISQTNEILDMNLDGEFDQLDKEVSYDLHFAIMTSQFSFSCGNLLPVYAKDSGIMILGETSGGGACMLSKYYTAETHYYAMSGPRKYISIKKKDVDSGAAVDVYLARPGSLAIAPEMARKMEEAGLGDWLEANDYSQLYDLDHVSKLIHTFYGDYTGEWVEGVWYDKDHEADPERVGQWKKNAKGWWFGDNLGWYAKNQWQKIDGKWYFFDKEGYMLKEAYQKDATGKIWYLGKNGALAGEKAATGWVQDSNGWMFYTDDQNTLKKTWKMINGNWYYFKADGYLAMNEFVQGWWVNKTGAWKDPVRYSWHKSGSKWWYGVKDGWYAKDRSYTIDGKTYTFDKKGYTK